MTNFLFWFQMVMAFTHVIPLIINIADGKTEGLTLAMYVIFMVYLTLSFTLALSSYAQSKSKIRLQTIIIFANWLLLISIIVIVGIFAIPWRQADTVFCIIVAVLALGTVGKYRNLADPMARGWISVWCKSLPQLWLAYTMLFISHGASGYPLIALIAGHLTGIPRLIQVYLSGYRDGWDRPTKGLILGEVANVVTWCIVTIAWIYLRIY